MSNIQKTLERLAKMNRETEKTGSSTVKYFKAKNGKNNLLILPTPFTGDPFLEWGTHKQLLDQPFKDIVCEKHNRGETCLICQVIEDLKKQNWKGNFPIWKPIELKIRYFSPVIDLDNIGEGVQWWGYGKSVLKQFETWLLNLEEEETSFYDKESPEKIIVTYNPSASPADMYKLDKKSLKPFDATQNAEWEKQIKPLTELFAGLSKSQEDITTALENYMSRVNEELAATDPSESEMEDEEADNEEPSNKDNTRISKLESLKKK